MELEYRIRNARAETSASGVMLDKLSISQHVSPAHSAAHGQQPLAFQKLFLFTVLNALKKNYVTHSNWLMMVVRSLPYMEKSMPTFVLHVSEQLCRNMEVCLKRKLQKSEDYFPPDYLATVLEVLTIICHYCLLDSTGAGGCLIPSSAQVGGLTGGPGSPTSSGTNGSSEKTAGAGDIFVNLFRVFTFTDHAKVRGQILGTSRM